ncbi:thiamine phosphate synthase [Campylobacter sp. RM12327]|uniref:thiamine phosphate synthase n=1 Tax=Campylobacter sputorum TaxID=206 RepID=UPI00053C002D|nr:MULTISPECIES: thiamine phosphate synthase [Campylobacter]ASM39849.1 thiamine phosphate synthase [Campylobacter sputorum]MBE7357499.1 thiamine phosphate synthase [Campylobacter sp. RM11302]MBF6669201.1 thiamine phosphate synthase [Campylobacter sp. RM12327]MBF6674324.1 thiamine phosphate synthase [Campylobacter sp. RM13538]MBF6675365.1 thiamine phosphate synthase [Campylobacter sp. RM12321]
MSEIYAITDDILTPDETIEDQVLEILQNGIKFIQYRSKKSIQNEEIIKNLISLCEDFNAKLIINDNVNLAKKLKAHGVHIGKNDAMLKNTKEFLGSEFIIGVSCYNDINLAINSQNIGASYVAFGAAFKSATKPNALLSGIEIISQAKEKISLPICIIGGINQGNIADVATKKPDMIAMIEAIYKPNSIKENITNLRKKIYQWT